MKFICEVKYMSESYHENNEYFPNDPTNRRSALGMFSRIRFTRQNFGWWLFSLFSVILILSLLYSWLNPDYSYINPFLPLIDIILWPFGKSTVDNGNRLRIIIRSLAEGAKLTLIISFISVVVGFFIALLLAVILVNRSKLWGLRYVAQLYVDFYRSTPLLVQIFLVYFGLPALIPNLRDFNISIEILCGTIALSLNTAAYQAEILRSGILAIPVGQTEASRALGMTSWQTMRYVILPQAIRLIVPPLTNEIINIILNSSLVSVIGVRDLTKKAQSLQSYYFMWEIFFIAAIFYFIIAYSLSKITHVLERKLRIPGLGVSHD